MNTCLLLALSLCAQDDNPPWSSPYPLSPWEQRLARFADQRQARRSGERATWLRLSLRQPPSINTHSAGKFRMAQQLIALGKYSAAKRWLTEIVEQFPGTKASDEAEDQLMFWPYDD